MIEQEGWREDYDWIHAFEYAGRQEGGGGWGEANICPANPLDKAISLAPFQIADVKAIEAMVKGENDEEAWLMVGELRDGRWFVLDASCDYTGWD